MLRVCREVEEAVLVFVYVGEVEVLRTNGVGCER